MKRIIYLAGSSRVGSALIPDGGEEAQLPESAWTHDLGYMQLTGGESSLFLCDG